MTDRGEVKDKVVVLEPGTRLADGTIVRVGPVIPAPVSGLAEADPLFRIGELAVETGIPDLATHADHYLYGHPNVGNAREDGLP
jgi:hypothetical protein